MLALRPGIVSCAVVMVALAAGAAPARADGLDAERFAPAVGTEPGFAFEHPLVPFHLGWGLGLFVDFADDAVVERDSATGDVLSRPLDTAATVDLVGSLGLFGWSEIGVHLPIQAVYSGDDHATGGALLSASGGLGDLRLVPKFLLLRRGDAASHVLLGASIPVTLPTGDGESLRGADGVTVEPRLTAAWHGERIGLGLGAGYRWRAERPVGLPWGDEIALSAMAGFALSDALTLQAELFGGVQVRTDDEEGDGDVPLEALLGVIYGITPDWHLHAGAGLGLTDGIGAPDLRLVAGVRYRRGAPERRGFLDRDEDGILDKDDDCPEEVEDLDAFQDEDGCPEADNDLDGILDEEDECPDLPEEEGGDGDGCPSRTFVKIVGGEVQIFGKVQFKTGSAEIDSRSDPLLDQIAAALRANPQVRRLRIEGHTDDTGEESVNRRLSEQRAESVERALTGRGIDGDRLEPRGYGESRPAAPNATAAGRAKNRRVEFIIVESGS